MYFDTESHTHTLWGPSIIVACLQYELYITHRGLHTHTCVTDMKAHISIQRPGALPSSQGHERSVGKDLFLCLINESLCFT